MGFYHRNEVYQAYVDTPLYSFAAEDPQMPETLRLVLSSDLCDSLAKRDIPKAAGCRLAALLEVAFAEALDERCFQSLSHAPHQGSACGRFYIASMSEFKFMTVSCMLSPGCSRQAHNV